MGKVTQGWKINTRMYRRCGLRFSLGSLAAAWLGLYSWTAIAAPAPVPGSHLGLGVPVEVQTSPTSSYPAYPGYPVSVPGVAVGGGFAGILNGIPTTFWCVDSQLYINRGVNSYLANAVRLTNLNQGAWDGATRYEDVSGYKGDAVSGPGWVLDLGDSFNVAEARFRMAAWLVSQYSGFPAGPSAGDARNQAIQRAIWRIMLNETETPNQNNSYILTGDISTGAPTGSSWIDAAKDYVSAHYNDDFFYHWAIVSGGLLSSGDGYVFDPNNKKQTFLVRAAPEPGFYGLLALGLAGLLLAFQRRFSTSTKTPDLPENGPCQNKAFPLY